MLSRSQSLRDFLNRRLAFQPDAKDVPGRIDVAIVRRSAVRASPASYSKRTHTFRAAGRYAPTSRARLGTPSLRHIDICGLPSGSFIPQHMPEHRPAGVGDGFGHLRSLKLGGAHIADNDQTILPSDPRGLLVKVVAARVRAHLLSDETVERTAEACWQEDAIRATSKPRRVSWDECQPAEKAKWRLMARAALSSALGDQNG